MQSHIIPLISVLLLKQPLESQLASLFESASLALKIARSHQQCQTVFLPALKITSNFSDLVECVGVICCYYQCPPSWATQRKCLTRCMCPKLKPPKETECIQWIFIPVVIYPWLSWAPLSSSIYRAESKPLVTYWTVNSLGTPVCIFRLGNLTWWWGLWSAAGRSFASPPRYIKHHYLSLSNFLVNVLLIWWLDFMADDDAVIILMLIFFWYFWNYCCIYTLTTNPLVLLTSIYTLFQLCCRVTCSACASCAACVCCFCPYHIAWGALASLYISYSYLYFIYFFFQVTLHKLISRQRNATCVCIYIYSMVYFLSPYNCIIALYLLFGGHPSTTCLFSREHPFQDSYHTESATPPFLFHAIWWTCCVFIDKREQLMWVQVRDRVCFAPSKSVCGLVIISFRRRRPRLRRKCIDDDDRMICWWCGAPNVCDYIRIPICVIRRAI